jgi:hypothetical protein
MDHELSDVERVIVRMKVGIFVLLSVRCILRIRHKTIARLLFDVRIIDSVMRPPSSLFGTTVEGIEASVSNCVSCVSWAARFDGDGSTWGTQCMLLALLTWARAC